MVEIFKTVPGRDSKMGYVAGVLVAIVALVVIPIHSLVTGITNNLFITYIWFGVHILQALWLTFKLRRRKFAWRTISKEILATCLYAWRPV
jgi:predicted ABC-type exoprotein transport system permease subunit